MTVKELIKELSEFAEDMEVFVTIEDDLGAVEIVDDFEMDGQAVVQIRGS